MLQLTAVFFLAIWHLWSKIYFAGDGTLIEFLFFLHLAMKCWNLTMEHLHDKYSQKIWPSLFLKSASDHLRTNDSFVLKCASWVEKRNSLKSNSFQVWWQYKAFLFVPEGISSSLRDFIILVLNIEVFQIKFS